MSIVFFQVRVARRVRDLATAARQVRAAGVVLLVACVVFALSAAGDSPLVAAGKHGQYQGFFGSGFTIARMLGPPVTTMVIGWGTAGWLLLGGVFLMAGLATVPAVRAARARTLLRNGKPDGAQCATTPLR